MTDETTTKKTVRELRGTVISNKADKTVTVRVERLKMNQKYKKQFKVSTNYAAHDPENTYEEGDVVIIRLGRPRSKSKRWEVVGKVSENK